MADVVMLVTLVVLLIAGLYNGILLTLHLTIFAVLLILSLKYLKRTS